MKNLRGQSLFEVVIAIAVSTVIIVSLVSLVSSSIRNSTFSRNKTLASHYSQEATEWLRGQRDDDTDVFLTKAQTTTWCLKDLSWSITGSCGAGNEISATPFKREVGFVTTDVGGKTVIEAEVKVFWNDSQGDHEVVNSTFFTDWRER